MRKLSNKTPLSISSLLRTMRVEILHPALTPLPAYCFVAYLMLGGRGLLSPEILDTEVDTDQKGLFAGFLLEHTLGQLLS
jgi:hypothetical protein